MTPALVSSNLSGKEPKCCSITPVADADEFARESLDKIGRRRMTVGFWPHLITLGIQASLPEGMLLNAGKNFSMKLRLEKGLPAEPQGEPAPLAICSVHAHARGCG